MQRLRYFVVMVLAAACPVLSQTPETKTPYQLLYAEWKAEVAGLENSSPRMSKGELSQGKQQINARFTPRFVELAEKHLDDEAVWLYCVRWVSLQGTPGESLDKLFDLVADNVEKIRDRSGSLVGSMDSLLATKSDRISPTLALLAEKHTSEYLRGNALFTLACRTRRLAELDGNPAGCVEAEKLFDRVISEYPKLRNGDGQLAEQAKGWLEELRGPRAISQVCPAIQGVTISGQTVDLQDFRGKVTILSFSAHWCGPCVAMHDVQKELLKRYSPDRLRIIEINNDRKDSLEAVRKKVAADGLEWMIIADGIRGPITKAWRNEALPTYCVLDVEGRIRYRGVGAIGDQLSAWVEKLVPSED